MRDEEWSELAARNMARHVTTFRRRGGRLYAVQSLRLDGGHARAARSRRWAWVGIVAGLAGVLVLLALGGGR